MTTLDLPTGVQINAPILPGFETILTRPALELVAILHRDFDPRRQQLLALLVGHERVVRLRRPVDPGIPARHLHLSSDRLHGASIRSYRCGSS